MPTHHPQPAWQYGSVCSGIEAVSLAWQPLGLHAAWFAEIDPFACAVLAHHYPHIPNLGDMTHIAAKVRAGSVVAPDILVGGTPCQSFSTAGCRQGLDDPRGALTLTPLWSLPMSLTRFATNTSSRQPFSSGKTSPACWATAPMPLDDCWAHWPEKAVRLSQQGTDGRTQVLCLDRIAASPGACWTHNVSASPNAARACFLWQVVETTSIPPKYFLSAKGSAGLLRRARRCGKPIPAQLEHTLRQQTGMAD